MDLELDPDPELTPPHELRQGVDGARAGDAVDPKLR